MQKYFEACMILMKEKNFSLQIQMHIYEIKKKVCMQKFSGDASSF